MDMLRAFDFRGGDLGQSLGRYNGAIRYDITNDQNLVKHPFRFLTILKQLERETNVTPSYGLCVKTANRTDYIHFLLEVNAKTSIGIFYFDINRTIQVPQIHTAERLVKQANLNGGIIISNQIGVPAKKEVKRINTIHGEPGILTIEQYDSILKRYTGSE